MLRAPRDLVNGRLGVWLKQAGLRRALIWTGLLTAGALGLQMVPLFNVLGFDFAFAMGLGVAFAATDIGHGVVPSDQRAGIGVLAVRGFTLTLLALVVPFLVSVGNAVRVRNCNLGAGVIFFALLPVGTALFAAPAGVLVAHLVPRRSRLSAWLVPVGSILLTLYRLYVDPAVFAFDPFGGYFPGPIYDEAMQPPPRLLWFRLANLVWIGAALTIFAVVRAYRQRKPLSKTMIGTAALLGLTGVGLFMYRGHLGFHVTRARLIQLLSRETRTAHFILFTDPHVQSDDDVARVVRDLEFRHQQLTTTFGPAPDGPITVYQFPSSESKKTLVGAGSTLYAKPWTREIFVQIDRFPARRLRHELAHVFAGSSGDPIFGVSLAVSWKGPIPIVRLASGLIEGIAEAADYGDPDGASTIHQEAAAMVRAGLAPPLTLVVGAGFSTLSGARAYTVAGSFCHFLLRTYGGEKLRAAYRSAGDFPAVYGKSLGELDSAWHAFLAAQPVPATEQARARERFRRGAIFQKVCARDLAARLEEARGILYVDPSRAIAILDGVCRDDPFEPTYKLDLADALNIRGDGAGALKLSAQIEADRSTTDPVRARAASLSASLHLFANHIPDAQRAVDRALTLVADEGERRTLVVKRRALADDRARGTIGRILFGDSATRGVESALAVFLIADFSTAFPDEALGPYLMARQLAHRDARLALPVLERACPLDSGSPRMSVPLEPAFEKECLRLQGETAFAAGDLSRSRHAHERLRDLAPSEADRLRAVDFLARLDWEGGRPN